MTAGRLWESSQIEVQGVTVNENNGCFVTMVNVTIIGHSIYHHSHFFPSTITRYAPPPLNTLYMYNSSHILEPPFVWPSYSSSSTPDLMVCPSILSVLIPHLFVFLASTASKLPYPSIRVSYDSTSNREYRLYLHPA